MELETTRIQSRRQSSDGFGTDKESDPVAAANFMMHIITNTLSKCGDILDEAERQMLLQLKTEFDDLPTRIPSK